MSRPRRIATVCFCAVLLCVISAAAVGDEQAIGDWDYQSSVTPANYTYGWEFTVAQSLIVTHLGLWDYGQDGLMATHLVRIWTGGGSELASGTVPSGATTFATWRWAELSTPVSLAPGSYVIGAVYGTGTDYLAANVSPFNVSSEIAYVQMRFASGSQFPDQANPSANGIFGPNFRYLKPDPVPEPALI